MPRKKSKSYPFFSLEEALELSKMVYQVGGNSIAPVESILSQMNLKSPQNKRYGYTTSSAKQFGLIESKEGGFIVTELAMSILYPTDENNQNVSNSKKRAAMMPELYKVVLSQFNGSILPKEEFLINIFIKNGILLSVADKAVQAFLNTMKYANLIDKDDRVQFNEDYLIPENDQKESVSVDKVPPNKKKRKISRILNDLPNDEKSHTEEKNKGEFNKANNAYNLEIPLTSGKKAFIVIPNDVSRDEIELIKNFIDAIKPTE